MRATLAAVALLLAGSPVLAGDFADREIYGFSGDGAYFAFEEYGVADGSGFPYSNVFVIDTATDSWVRGTPIRVWREDETAPLAKVRAEARAKARPILERHHIGVPGVALVVNPITEEVPNRNVVRFRVNPYLGDPALRLTLTLAPIFFEPSESCAPHGDTFGFRLTLSSDTGASRVLHEDKGIPASRGCVHDYAISDVIVIDEGTPATVIAVLVSVFMQGFEGPDRRFVAVTAQFQQPLD